MSGRSRSRRTQKAGGEKMVGEARRELLELREGILKLLGGFWKQNLFFW
jgi:hypothetical protein